MFSIMQRTVNRSLLPFGITDGSLIANKTGDISTVLGDVALVDAPNGKRYALATLVERPNNDGRASELIRRTAEAVHKEFSQPIAPVGGLDPSVPEDSVPAPASPEDAPGEPGLSPNGTLEQPQESSPNREQIPQG
jgi:beta-lactamase class A